MAEDDRAHGPCEEGEPEGHKAVHQLRRVRTLGKEERPEHQRRRGAIDIEIIKFDCGADEARGQDTPVCSIGCQIHGRCPSPLLFATLWAGALTDASMNAMRVSALRRRAARARSEEHTSELQSLMRISYAVFCLKKKNQQSISQRQETKS